MRKQTIIGITLLTSGMAILSTGCSTSKMAVGAMIPILENSKTAALASNDIKTFEKATPANLFLLEGLIETDPRKTDLRVSASMLYFSYAFAFNEEQDPSYASLLYNKGFEHGKLVLFENAVVADAWNKPFDEFAESMAAIKKGELPALMWTVANWAQFISLHLDSTAVLTQIPRANALLERAVELDETYFEGLPHMMLGSLHAFRPPLMGGDPEASLTHFEKAFDISERKFLLAQYFYAKFYCYRIQDVDEFERTLNDVMAQPDTILPEYQLLNVIAKQRAHHLIKEKDELY